MITYFALMMEAIAHMLGVTKQCVSKDLDLIVNAVDNQNQAKTASTALKPRGGAVRAKLHPSQMPSKRRSPSPRRGFTALGLAPLATRAKNEPAIWIAAVSMPRLARGGGQGRA